MAVIRNTKSVRAVLEVFKSSENPYSSVQLIDHFKGEMNKTTVYRILDRLRDGGVLHSFTDKSGLQWYAKCQEGCTSHEHVDLHPHFQCKDCGKTECIDVDFTLPSVGGHKIESAEFLLVGICEDCLE